MTEVSTEEFPDSIIEASRDHKKVTFVLGGDEYTAERPRKVEEWLVEIQMGFASPDSGRGLLEIDNFFRKIIGPESFHQVKEKRLSDDSDLTWSEMASVMHDLVEVWTTEQDQPIRPTGPRSGSGRGRKKTIQK